MVFPHFGRHQTLTNLVVVFIYSQNQFILESEIMLHLFSGVVVVVFVIVVERGVESK